MELSLFYMKRIGNLYERIADYDNLLLAFYKASKGKKEKTEVKEFRENLTSNICRLSVSVLNGNINWGNYHFFTIKDPKVRRICAASFEERVLHHALVNITGEIFDLYQIFDSYACRKNKGQLKAVDRAQVFSHRNKFFLKMDISKYFDSIDHDFLMVLLRKLFKDRKLLKLFEDLIYSYKTQPCKGIPIGNLTSQYFANLYLGCFDHYVKEKLQIKHYLRYMDDFVIWNDSKEELKRLKFKIENFLSNSLKLRLKDSTALNHVRCGMNFLGYTIFPNKILLSQRSRRRFRYKIKKYEKNYIEGIWSCEQLISHVQPLLAFSANCSSKLFRSKVLNSLEV